MNTMSAAGNSASQNRYMKYMFVALSLIFLNSGILTAEEKTDFTGTWKFNESRSELAEGRFRGAASQLTVSQNENELMIEKRYIRSSGEEFSSTEKLSLDGNECINIVFGDNEKKSTATWAEEKKRLTINSIMEFEREGEPFTITITEAWSLSDDGKSLIIDYTSVSPRGERKNKFVYDKAE